MLKVQQAEQFSLRSLVSWDYHSTPILCGIHWLPVWQSRLQDRIYL